MTEVQSQFCACHGRFSRKSCYFGRICGLIGRCVEPWCGFSVAGYVEQLSKFTLKKFLLLVLFLDKSKLTKLIDHDPVLFNKDAPFKVSASS